MSVSRSQGAIIALTVCVFSVVGLTAVHAQVSAIPTVLRCLPDPGTVVAQSTKTLSLEFSRPVETNKGSIYVEAISGSSFSWETPVVSPNVWVLHATVTIDLPSQLPVGKYQVKVPAGTFLGSDGGFLFGGLDFTWSFEVNENGPMFYNASIPEQPHQQATVEAFKKQINQDNLNATMAHLSSYYNRFFQSETGLEAAQWVVAQFTAIAEQYGRTDVTVKPFPHRWRMHSTIVHIPGQTDEVVILGAHLDSINRQNWTVNVQTGRAPGANDDGSGIALLLEFFRIMMANNFKPIRGVELHCYSGEEEGLYGSSDVAASYQRGKAQVASMLMLDQCGYLRDPEHEVIAVYTDNTDVKLTSYMKTMITTYTDVPYVVSNEDDRADSDFHSWTRNGFRSAYIAEGPIDDIVYGNAKHSRHDILSTVSLPHVVHVGEAALGYLIELAQDS